MRKMHKKVRQNHPRCEGRGLWAQLKDNPSKKGVSLSNRREDSFAERRRSTQMHLVGQLLGTDQYKRKLLWSGNPDGRFPLRGNTSQTSNTLYGVMLNTKQPNISPIITVTFCQSRVAVERNQRS